MVFIRIKKINNSPYGYLVESVNTSSGPRQKVKQYLGRVFEFERKVSTDVVSINSGNKEELLLNLVVNELNQRGFDKDLSFNTVTFDKSSFSLNKGKRGVVMLMNEGYLCDFTLGRILNFKKSKNLDKDAHTLAKYFLEAGLQISEEDFVKFYGFL
jgi:hypothetical protein